jgi:two-component system, cell cycle response regulator
MTAKVLVVDDILANVRLLEAKLMAEYFEVSTAMNGLDALECVQRIKPDIVLLDVMMPGMDGIEVCRRIKSNSATLHIPVIMVTALDQPEDRVRGLEAGADDFLTKPVNDLALFCRVKSLVRLKMLTDELLSRHGPEDEEFIRRSGGLCGELDEPGRVLLVDNRGLLHERIKAALMGRHQLDCVSDPQKAVLVAAETSYELVLINLDLDGYDGLRLCSQLRSLQRTRQVPILIIVDPDDHHRMIKALDMGVNDYLMRPIDRQELLARANTQIRRSRFTTRLRNNVQQSMELAVTDALTGLYNRRHMDTQVAALVDSAANRGTPLSVLAVDVDHFKSVNDSHGHDAGDRVLQELAARIRKNTRSLDLAFRTGGEEFVIVLPSTDRAVALKVAERLRRSVSAKPFNAGARAAPLPVTISVGIASLESPNDTLEELLKRADLALYRAKREGRNRVIADAA